MDREVTTMVSTEVARDLSTKVHESAQPTPQGPLRGSVLVLIQFDVCEEIRLDELRQIFGARTVEQPSFKHPAPGYVRYQRPPVVEPIEPLILDSGERLARTDQVLRLRRPQRGLRAAVFRRLGHSGSTGQPLGLGRRLREARLAHRPPEAGARRPGPGQALSRNG